MAETTKEDLVFSVAFGPLHPPLAEQLRQQGVEASEVDEFERVRSAITFLNLHNYMTDGAAASAKNKLMRNLQKNSRRLSA